MTHSVPALGTTIEVVDKTGKVVKSGITIFQALREAKAAYHARRAEIDAERAMKRANEAAKLAAMEKEARRAVRQRKRIEHQKRVEGREKKKKEEPKAIEGSKMKAIEWRENSGSDTKDKENDKKRKEKKDRSSGKELVVYGESKEKQEKVKEKKEKKEERDRGKKHRHHSGEKKRKGSASSVSSSSTEGERSSLVPAITSPPTPPPDDDLELSTKLILHDKTCTAPLADAIANLPGGALAAQALHMAPHIVALIDPNGDSPLSALLLQLTNILDTLDCLNASIVTLMAVLEKDRTALAGVGLLLAEISAIIVKTAPSVVLAAKVAFPFIFSLLSSPQFFVVAGAGVIIMGGYKIISKFTGLGAPAPAEVPIHEDAHDDDEHLAYGPGAEDHVTGHNQQSVEGPKRALTLPAPAVASSVAEAVELPPTPPKTPTGESQETKEKEKDPKKGKRQTLKRFFTTVN